MDDEMPRAKTISDEELLAAMDRADVPSPSDINVVTVPDIAELVDLGEDAIRNRLHTLHDEGRVGMRKVGARASVWWRTD